MTSQKSSRILSVAPVYRGIGFVVMDDGPILVDWGVKETRWNKLIAGRDRVADLIDLHHPDILVLELTGVPFCRRRQRIRELISELATVAAGLQTPVAFYERRVVHETLGVDPSATKDTLAAAVAIRLPTLAPRLPKPRRAWETQKHSMAIFEAAAFALAHIESDRGSCER